MDESVSEQNGQAPSRVQSNSLKNTNRDEQTSGPDRLSGISVGWTSFMGFLQWSEFGAAGHFGRSADKEEIHLDASPMLPSFSRKTQQITAGHMRDAQDVMLEAANSFEAEIKQFLDPLRVALALHGVGADDAEVGYFIASVVTSIALHTPQIGDKPPEDLAFDFFNSYLGICAARLERAQGKMHKCCCGGQWEHLPFNEAGIL